MPTKISKSPLTLPVGLIAQGVKGIVGGMAGGIRNVSQAIKDVDKEEFKDMKFGEKLKTGLGVYGKGLKGFLGGTAQGLVGNDFGLVNDGAEEIEQETQPEYTTNIDPMTGEEKPLMMTGNMKPLKMLTGVNSPMTYKMSAAQYKSGLKMSEISGANTLPSALTLKGDQYKIDANKDGEITGEDFKLLKK